MTKNVKPPKRTSSLQKMNFFNFSLVLWVICALLDPDPDQHHWFCVDVKKELTLSGELQLPISFVTFVCSSRWMGAMYGWGVTVIFLTVWNAYETGSQCLTFSNFNISGNLRIFSQIRNDLKKM
jgi:hypothetical protein